MAHLQFIMGLKCRCLCERARRVWPVILPVKDELKTQKQTSQWEISMFWREGVLGGGGGGGIRTSWQNSPVQVKSSDLSIVPLEVGEVEEVWRRFLLPGLPEGPRQQTSAGNFWYLFLFHVFFVHTVRWTKDLCIQIRVVMNPYFQIRKFIHHCEWKWAIQSSVITSFRRFIKGNSMELWVKSVFMFLYLYSF